MGKTGRAVDDDGNSAGKAIWDDQLTLIFCEICIKEVDAGNRPTTHLNSIGWRNVTALFKANTGRNYGKYQLKNRWDTLKKEWKLWSELRRSDTSIGWDPVKKTLAASNDWWAQKIQENPHFKMFKKRGISEELNEKLWRMFSDNDATRDHAWASSSGILPSEASKEDVTHVEVLGDLNDAEYEDEENNNLYGENENDPDALVGSSNPAKRAMKVVQRQGKKAMVVRTSGGINLSSNFDKLCDTMTSPGKSVSATVFPRSPYGVEEAMDALRAMPDEIPKRTPLYYFATKLFQTPVKRQIFLNLDSDLRSWWIQCEYEDYHGSARVSSLPAKPPCGLQPFQQTRPPPPSGPMM